MVKIGIEKQSEITFEIQFTLSEFNNLVYLFKRCLLSCLCIKDCEEQFILQMVQNESCQTILEAKSDIRIAKKIINSFYEQSFEEKPQKVSNLLEMRSISRAKRL